MVYQFPATTTNTVEQALASAVAFQEHLQDVLIVGYDDKGELYIRSSRMDRKDALWLAHELIDYARCKA